MSLIVSPYRLLFCGLLLAWPLLSLGSEPALPSAQAQRQLLLDVARAGPRLVVVGDRGHVLYSDDEATSWTQASVPLRQLLTAVFFLDDRRGWAVGHDASILSSDDGGASWSLQFSDAERELPLLDVVFLDGQRGLAAGAYGTLLQTRDGGQHWEDIGERLDNEEGLHLNALLHLGGERLLIVGEQGLLQRSEDGGETWEALDSPYSGSWFGALATDTGGVLLFGLRGNLWYSPAWGEPWHEVAQQPEVTVGLSGATRLADGRLVVVGHGGSVLTGDAAAAAFTSRTRAGRQSLSAVAELKDGRWLLLGQTGAMVVTEQGE